MRIQTYKARAVVGFALSARPGVARNVGMYWAIHFWKQGPQDPQSESCQAARETLPGIQNTLHTCTRSQTQTHTHTYKYT